MLHRIIVLGIGAALALASVFGSYLLIGNIGVVAGAVTSIFINVKILDWTQAL